MGCREETSKISLRHMMKANATYKSAMVEAAHENEPRLAVPVVTCMIG